MSLYHISDIHCGAVRSGGTTPATSWQLRLCILERFREILDQIDDDLIINGDLFDTFNVPLHDFLGAYFLLSNWLLKGHYLILPPGNHDLAKNTLVKSSFQALCDLLHRQFPEQVRLAFVPMRICLKDNLDIYVIPHLPNQDLFNLAIERVPACKYLFLHCNFDNKFAMQQDQSLNLSPDQARALPVERIIIAHEHQRKIGLAGKVILPGNQIPTSVADCLGNKDKHMLRLSADKLEYLPTWEADGDFQRIDWQELAQVDPKARFIRVQGKATPAEAPAVVTAVSKLRSVSSALVITNAVEIGSEDESKLEVSLEQIKAFDVMTALMKYLTKEEGQTVQKLLKENDVPAS